MNNFGYVMATKMLVEGKRKVRFMYRQEPDNDQDSGWRFFCGDEDDASEACEQSEDNGQEM